MYGAFSFGKIIKTILPGSVLAGALVLLCETAWFAYTGSSFLGLLAMQELLTVAGAILVPVSLLLGFILNTFVWLHLNGLVRKRVDAQLLHSPFAELRAALCEQLQGEVTEQMGEPHARLCQGGWPARTAIEYYFLPVVSVEHLTHLWESYFSWYEFHLNTLCALAISVPFVWALLLVRFAVGPGWSILLCAGVALTVLWLCWMLWTAAIRNMLAYERNLVLLIAGSIAAATKDRETV